MKAVLYRYDWWEDGALVIPLNEWGVNDHINHLDDGERLMVRYDNGQLCTFRRKTKG